MNSRRSFLRSLLGTAVAAAAHNSVLALVKPKLLTRRLRGKWAVEVKEAIVATHGFDVDSKLSQAISFELSKEVSEEVMGRARGNLCTPAS